MNNNNSTVTDQSKFEEEFARGLRREVEEEAEFKKIWRPIVLAAQPSWARTDMDTAMIDWMFNFEIDGTVRVTVNSHDVFEQPDFKCSKAFASLATTMVWNRATREFISRDPVSAYIYVEEGKLAKPITVGDIDTIADGLSLFADWYRAAIEEDASQGQG